MKSNSRARVFQPCSHSVKLISPQFVKPFVKTNKNDANDAQAIVEAASRPSKHFVPIKGIEQQDIQSIHRFRSRVVKNRTALINEIRGLDFPAFVRHQIVLYEFFVQRPVLT
jgi:transposase